MKKAVDFYEEGYNCAESIIKVVNEEKNLNIPVSIASPFGRGMTVGSSCGAITGALMALGAIKGRKEAVEPNQSRDYTKKIMGKIKEKYGTFQCAELKKKGVSCAEIIEYTHGVLKEYID
ncbi:C-GCAxxG-C-C family (seleno)protein [Clostridium kluyveri]|uniref:Oxidoreductase n=1 Tax=Clostridium kluyveri TaxID=1534 RepID=A0A1L5F4R7_CLOKL|nr:C-GCAxxG-C-C family (seleno)protein [Clostridium kluyveri]APM38011.1 oxidoreductase [Clostridium kluyveri]UZQ51979.1 C-GCAxxG-C-C family protein [Clostridium kluyveri]